MIASPSDVLRQLGFVGLATPAALRASLGVSPQTLSRLVAALGDEVIRVGRGPATRIARTRAVEGLGRRVPVFRVNERGEVTPRGKLHFLWGSRTWWERSQPGRSRLFEGLPPALVDMAPQGYLGRAFCARHAGLLRLPGRIDDWSDDHRLIAIARRGEDCVGDLVVGDESLGRLLAQERGEAGTDRYPELARLSVSGEAGSSAGGERPKFGAFGGGRHVLVKFAIGEPERAARRWRDLLWCEWRALETVRAAGVSAATARCIDVAGERFLETERFDRVGPRGRRGLLSLMALANEELGHIDSWTSAALALSKPPFSLPDADARNLRWLDVFGQLIGNTDRHFGNVSFLVDEDGGLRLAPAYDTLPMILAPAGDGLARRELTPIPPGGTNLDVWPDAARWATTYWRDVRASADLDQEIRDFAGSALGAISALAGRIAPGQPG